ncbi:hypothetical protein [Octadecabacter sp. R77987]|uniref:hypothetical protein n=1 Tax=Octadecabacter sp. R77987 TaxID=3093874 RepID=UPI00366D4D1E
MTENTAGPEADARTAAERVEEARQLYRSINTTLTKMLKRLEDGDMSELHNLHGKLGELEKQMGRLSELELKYEHAYGDGTRPDEIDFDAIRHQIGCRLGRLSTCCGAEGLSGSVE